MGGEEGEADDPEAVAQPMTRFSGYASEVRDGGDDKKGEGDDDRHGKEWGSSAHSKGKGEGSAPPIPLADLPKDKYFGNFTTLPQFGIGPKLAMYLTSLPDSAKALWVMDAFLPFLRTDREHVVDDCSSALHTAWMFHFDSTHDSGSGTPK